MDCAPFKKPSRKAGLFSYRSVIPPSPHETLLAQISAGAPAARWAAMRGGVSLAAVFCKSYRALIPLRLLLPTKLCLRKFPRGPRPPGGRQCGAAYRLRRFFCKSYRALIPLRLLLPTKLCLRKFPRGPRTPCGRQLQSSLCSSFSPQPVRAAKRQLYTACGGFWFRARPFLDKERGICYADSQIIRKESVTHKTMDDGDSTEGENPPLPHIQSFIGHSLCLRE